MILWYVIRNTLLGTFGETEVFKCGKKEGVCLQRITEVLLLPLSTIMIE